jgi:hypothetical protein
MLVPNFVIRIKARYTAAELHGKGCAANADKKNASGHQRMSFRCTSAYFRIVCTHPCKRINLNSETEHMCVIHISLHVFDICAHYKFYNDWHF